MGDHRCHLHPDLPLTFNPVEIAHCFSSGTLVTVGAREESSAKQAHYAKKIYRNYFHKNLSYTKSINPHDTNNPILPIYLKPICPKFQVPIENYKTCKTIWAAIHIYIVHTAQCQVATL